MQLYHLGLWAIAIALALNTAHEATEPAAKAGDLVGYFFDFHVVTAERLEINAPFL